MSIDSKHPLYSEKLNSWAICRDFYEGDEKVKSKTETYLSATPGMVANGMTTPNADGLRAYNTYKARAVVPDYMATAIKTMIGYMWIKPPTIELPPQLEYMLESATSKGESLNQLLRRINEQQILMGRTGLLLDLPAVPSQDQPMPYISMYNAEHIINWNNIYDESSQSEVVNTVILDEGGYVSDDDFNWEYQAKYRVLMIESDPDKDVGAYKAGVFNDNDFNKSGLIIPSIRGKSLDKIPFVFINSKDIVSDPDMPPLLGLAHLSRAIYRGEADYRQSLFLQGQDTLVISGTNDKDGVTVGAGAVITLPANGDAKFIGVASDGISEQRQAIENDRMLAGNKAGELIDTRSKQKESGEALKTRTSAQTATLNSIALSGAEGLQSILRTAADWIGANPNDVVITPNLDFSNDEMAGRDLVDIVAAKTMGAPISNQSIHKMMQRKSMTDISYDDELSEIGDEAPLSIGREDI